jgi:hypothetical protein
MSVDPQPDPLSIATAEEVLRTIYGDDFAGCTVSLNEVAAVISGGLQQKMAAEADLLGLYEKVVEALHLLSTPPDKNKVTDPAELRTLLSERLDAIHAVTTKTMQTTALVKTQRSPGSSGSSSGEDLGSPSQ